MDFAYFSKGYREAKGLSVRKMAELIDVSQYRLEKWEQRKGYPKYEDSKKIKLFFGMNSLEDISEEFFKLIIELPEGVKPTASNEKVSELSERLLQEKDKRIEELTRTVNILEKELRRYRRSEVKV